MKHPVLDHTPRLRLQADRFGFDCTAAEWLGWDHRYPFRCTAGHEFLLTAQFLKTKQGGCRMCRGVEHLRRLQQLAERSGARCLSTEWAGPSAQHLFECAQGHRWQRAAGPTLGCRQCGYQSGALARRDSQGLQRLQQAAAVHGGQCLSDTYTLGNERYRFRCAEGHEWQARGHRVLAGSWCPLCAHAQRRAVSPEPQEELGRVREAALGKGGSCLDQESPGIGARYRFRCSEGHEWNALAERILELGSWCKRCSDAARGARSISEDGLQRLQALAAERGGECLSTEYMGLSRLVRLRCAKGHEWETQAKHPMQGAWCGLCMRDARRLSITDAQEAAAARGGKCLSQTYVNSHSKLSWMCDRGHVWQAILSSVRSHGTWCKQCSSMSYIRNRNSKARIKYQAAGWDLDTAAYGGATAAAPAKLIAPASGTSKPARPQGELKLTTRSSETEARTPLEDSSMT
jgi:hypothetical protein